MEQHEAVSEEHGAASGEHGDELLGRLDVIEAQPLEERAQRYDQLVDELLAELQRGDGGEPE